jgi:hypothetical protein
VDSIRAVPKTWLILGIALEKAVKSPLFPLNPRLFFPKKEVLSKSYYNIDLDIVNRLVRQPGWLSHKSHKILRILPLLSGSCSEIEVSEQH